MKLARYFHGQPGFSTTTVLPDTTGIYEDFRADGLPVVTAPVVRLRRIRSVLYLLKYLVNLLYIVPYLAVKFRRIRAEIVHVNEIIDYPALIAGKLAGCRTVCHVRAIIESPTVVRRFLAQVTEMFSDEVLCVSESVRLTMFGSGAAEKVRVLYDGGPDKAFLECSAEPAMVRGELGLGSSEFVVGLVSKFVEVKGHEYLVQAAMKMYDLGFTDIRYVMVGGPMAGHEAYYQKIQDMIRSHPVGKSFVQTGFRRDIPELMSAFDVLVHLPTYEDPFPGVVLEGLALSKPVIAFDSGGIREQFEDGTSGHLIPKRDLDALVSAILALYRDEANRTGMGSSARQFLTGHFTLERHFGEVTAVYGRLVH